MSQQTDTNFEIRYCINTVLCLFKVNSNIFELIMHTSCYYSVDFTENVSNSIFAQDDSGTFLPEYF